MGDGFGALQEGVGGDGEGKGGRVAVCKGVRRRGEGAGAHTGA